MDEKLVLNRVQQKGLEGHAGRRAGHVWLRLAPGPGWQEAPRRQAYARLWIGRGGGMVEDYQGNAYRAVYTVKFGDAVYVVHCFQKKSTRGIATPKPDMDLIRERLKAAQEHAKEQQK
jgi:hypothetical protein